MADQEEDGVRRRFLQHLEERVGRRLLELVNAVDDHRPPRRKPSGEAQELAKSPHLIDGDVTVEIAGLRIFHTLDPAQVRVTSSGYQLGNRMVFRGFEAGKLELRAGSACQ